LVNTSRVTASSRRSASALRSVATVDSSLAHFTSSLFVHLDALASLVDGHPRVIASSSSSSHTSDRPLLVLDRHRRLDVDRIAISRVNRPIARSNDAIARVETDDPSFASPASRARVTAPCLLLLADADAADADADADDGSEGKKSLVRTVSIDRPRARARARRRVKFNRRAVNANRRTLELFAS
jgi:hypothetical protein